MTEKFQQLADKINAEHAAIIAAGGLAKDKTLRDEIAIHVIAGLAAAEPNAHWMTHFGCNHAYEVADAMLEARKTPHKGDTP
jgi:hypothetical protein